jgi:hypothetical protein
MIIKPARNLDIDYYIVADFAGQTGCIITLGGCPVLWKSHLQNEISLSTLKAEYSALSSTLRTLLPLRSMIQEIVSCIKLPHTFTSTIKCQVFEDNNGALLLAVNQRITYRQGVDFLGIPTGLPTTT